MDNDVRMLTVKQASEKSGTPISTINLYCRNGTLPNAIKCESPIGDYWLIPESDLEFIPKRGRGRPKKTRN